MHLIVVSKNTAIFDNKLLFTKSSIVIDFKHVYLIDIDLIYFLM